MTPDWTTDFREGCRFWFGTVLTYIFAVIGIIGNLVTVIVLTRKRMKSSTNTYLTALAVSDLIYLALRIVLSLEHRPWLNHPDYILYWKLWGFVIWLTDAANGVSVWLTVSFTMERYIAVCHPLRGKIYCTESRARKVIAAIVLICPLLIISTVAEWRAGVEFNPVTNTTRVIHVTELGKNPIYKAIFYWFTSIFFIVIPFLIVAALNTLLIKAVRRSQRRRGNLTEDRRVQNSIKNPTRNTSIVDDTPNSKKIIVPRLYKERQENKITKALVAVVCLFLFCQAPGAVILIIHLFHDPVEGTPSDNILRGVGNIGNFFLLVNATCNFMLYCAMSDKYRQTLYKTFCPSRSYRHVRTNTFTSAASFRNSSFQSPRVE